MTCSHAFVDRAHVMQSECVACLKIEVERLQARDRDQVQLKILMADQIRRRQEENDRLKNDLLQMAHKIRELRAP